jgi:hypothetical protein
MTMLRATAVLVVAALAACEHDVVVSDVGAKAPNAHWLDLANDLAMLAAGRASTPAELDKLAKVQFSRDAFSTYIAELLKTPEAGDLAERVLHVDIGALRSVTTMAVLEHTEVKGETIYYLHKTCDRADAVKVNPWWELSKPVLVCRDSYKPDVFGDGKGAYCTGHLLSPVLASSPCGCGPNLIRCTKNLELRNQIQRAVVDEHKGTIAYIVGNNLPIQTVFNANESFRNRLAEFLYQRQRIESGELRSLDKVKELATWPENGKWAPRHESRKGQHSGFMTNNYYPHSGDSVRLKMVDLFNSMWCDVVQSSGVSTSSLLDLTFRSPTNVNFRGQTNVADLTEREGCTNCHARIDFGAQFYAGHSWSILATHYDVRRQLDTPGPMYMSDIKDARGTVAQRNPASFMALALAQPEFAACIATNLETHVFGKQGNHSTALTAEVEDLVKKRAGYQTLLARVLAVYTDARFADAGATSKPLEGDLVAWVHEHCSDCHDADDERAPGLFARHGAAWCSTQGDRCPDVALDMLVSVANGRMPRNQPMTTAQRVAMVEQLATHAWPDAKERAAALPAFVEQAIGGVPIHRSEALVRSIRALSANPPPDTLPPILTLQTFGTSLAATLGVVSARVCSHEKNPGECMQRALSPDRILKK